jgi:hypothetical protein
MGNEFRCFPKLEVEHGGEAFSRELKVEMVKLVSDRGYPWRRETPETGRSRERAAQRAKELAAARR